MRLHVYCLVTALLMTMATVLAEAKSHKVTMKQAKAIALRLHPGSTIKSAEREKENGLQIYSFDVQTKNGLREVNVDSASGRVVEDSVESPASEAQEKAASHRSKEH
ncbi:MAG: PepSY domain-containing protein [Bryobacteraceae bacterium]